MEPQLITAARLVPVLEELKLREPLFHRPELGATRRDFENMTDAAFWEAGVRVTRRATLWRRSKSGWKVLYHQGTVVDPVS